MTQQPSVVPRSVAAACLRPSHPRPLCPPRSQKHKPISHRPGGRTAQLRSPHGCPGTPTTLLLTGCLMITCMATFHSTSQDIKHSGVADKDRKNSSRYQRLRGPHHLSIWSTTAESWGHTRAPLLSDSASSPALCRKQTCSQILWESPVLGEDTQLLTWIFSLLRS